MTAGPNRDRKSTGKLCGISVIPYTPFPKYVIRTYHDTGVEKDLTDDYRPLLELL